MENLPETFDIGQAVKLLKEGMLVARSGWNGKGMYLTLADDKSSHFVYTGVGNTGNCIQKITSDKPYVCMRTAQGAIQPGWLASQEDLLATDWCVVPVEE